MLTKAAHIAGGGKQTLATALGIPGLQARAVQFISDTANSALALVGGSDINLGSASPLVHPTGIPVLKTAYLCLPLLTENFVLYDFDLIWVEVQTGDVLYVLYEQG